MTPPRRRPGGGSALGLALAQAQSHRNWVVNVSMQRGGGRRIVSGSVTGDIKFWDIRYGLLGAPLGGATASAQPVRTLEAHRSPMSALAVHPYAPVLASGSHNQCIKVVNTDGDTLSMTRYHDGFLGQRIGPVSCLAFHPHCTYLAAGATDSIISIYKTG